MAIPVVNNRLLQLLIADGLGIGLSTDQKANRRPGSMGERSLIAAIAATLLTAPAPAHASPWNRETGGLFASTTANYYWSDDGANSYSRIDNDTYLEFGVTPAWMLGGRASFGNSFSKSAAGTTADSGLNEAEIYLQRQIQRGEHSATSLKMSGIRSGSLSTDAQSGAPTPNMEIEFRALHGRDVVLNPIKLFAAAELGYRRRLGGDADQIRADALIGAEPSSNWLVLLEAQSIVSLQNETPGFADFDLYKGQASIVWRKSPKWSFIVGFRKEIAARNLVAGSAMFAGLWSAF